MKEVEKGRKFPDLTGCLFTLIWVGALVFCAFQAIKADVKEGELKARIEVLEQRIEQLTKTPDEE